MNGKDLWVKKFSFDRGTGHLYLIADFKRMSEGHRLIVHEIAVRFEGLEDRDYDYRVLYYDLEAHMAHSVPPERIARSVFERHEVAFANGNTGSDSKKKNDDPLSLEEIDSGKQVLFDLQFTEIFPELKVEILKEPRSDTFGKILTTMTHLPLRAERREMQADKKKKGPRKAAKASG